MFFFLFFYLRFLFCSFYLISFNLFYFIQFHFISSIICLAFVDELWHLLKPEMELFTWVSTTFILLYYFILFLFIYRFHFIFFHIFYMISFISFISFNFISSISRLPSFNELRHVHKQEMELWTCVYTSFYFCQLFTDPCWGKIYFLLFKMITLLI